jgi:hypothetical protein
MFKTELKNRLAFGIAVAVIAVATIGTAISLYDLRSRQNHVVDWVQGFHQRGGSPVPAEDDIRFVFSLLHDRGYTDKEIYACATFIALDRCLYEAHHPSAALLAGIRGWEGPYFPFPQ